MGQDDWNYNLSRALAALSSLAVCWLAAHPDTLDRLAYRARLYLAYHPQRLNMARLRHMRRLFLAGAYADDSRATSPPGGHDDDDEQHRHHRHH